MLDERKLEVLRAIVTDYVASHEPVGSKALVDRHHMDVSAATIRNDMAVLEEDGYVTQPHTSAGRIPTDKGYRLFVDRLATVKPLSAAEQRAIATFIEGAVDLDDIVARTVRLLAQITRQVAIVQYPSSSQVAVRHVELIGLTTDRALLIVITSTGAVEQRAVDIPAHSEDELAGINEWMNRSVRGKKLDAAATAVEAALELLPADRRHRYASAARPLIHALSQDSSNRVIVGGVPNLARFGAMYETTIRPVLETLEEQVVLLRLLGEAAADATAGDVSVRIGEENSYEQLRSTSIVAGSYEMPDSAQASLGVVGPTHMDYPSTMAAVRAVARYISKFFAEG
jgi:heat-inducible transcriptional repressor